MRSSSISSRQWFEDGHRVSPITKEELPHFNLTPDDTLRQRIVDFKSNATTAMQMNLLRLRAGTVQFEDLKGFKIRVLPAIRRMGETFDVAEAASAADATAAPPSRKSVNVSPLATLIRQKTIDSKQKKVVQLAKLCRSNFPCQLCPNYNECSFSHLVRVVALLLVLWQSVVWLFIYFYFLFLDAFVFLNFEFVSSLRYFQSHISPMRTQKFGDGSSIYAEWVAGQPHGLGIWTSPTGEPHGARWSWTSDDEGFQILDTGEWYEGRFLAGRRHGHGQAVWLDGSSYVGDWVQILSSFFFTKTLNCM